MILKTFEPHPIRAALKKAGVTLGRAAVSLGISEFWLRKIIFREVEPKPDLAKKVNQLLEEVRASLNGEPAKIRKAA